jgi:hypothetical protein
MNTSGIPKSLLPQTPQVCQDHATTRVLLVGTNHTSNHNYHSQITVETTRTLSAQEGRSDHIKGAVRLPMPSTCLLNRKPCKRAQNLPWFHQNTPTIKANSLPEKYRQNQTSHRESPNLPPETWARVNPQLPIDRSPNSPHRLQRNFGDRWVTSWMTSPPKDIHWNALNQRESQIVGL